MRSKETHFEQVPIEVVETVLRQAMAGAKMLEKPAAPVSAAKRQAVAESPEREEGTRSQGWL